MSKKVEKIISANTNRRAISTVLTTMIILVASVVLGTGVVLYGTSIFQVGAQTQSFITDNTQVWVDKSQNSGWAWAAFNVRNSGDKPLLIDQIQIRGQAVPFANWYVESNQTRLTSTQFQTALIYTSMINKNTGVLNNGTAFNASWPTISNCPPSSVNMVIDLASGQPSLCFTQQSNPVSLAPGVKAIIYFKVPQNLLTSLDAGATVNVAIYAGPVGGPTTSTILSK